MDEPEREPPHAGKRLTREDVLRLIEEHGGPEGLDLSERNLREADLCEMDLRRVRLPRANLRGANLQGANLSEANLRGADLRQANLQKTDFCGANLQGAQLQGANLEQAHLHRANLVGSNLQRAHVHFANVKEAHLFRADLREANLTLAGLEQAHLWEANLQGADLRHAELLGADLRRADLQRAHLAGASVRDANLEAANWGDYVLGDEIEGDFGGAASAYRALKQRHAESGMYDVAGEFHYREMEARRKLAWKGDLLHRQKRRVPYALILNALRFLYGYGERPERVIGWAAAVVFGLALVHWVFGTVAGGFLDALYYSAVSFTALGYGASASDPQGWAGRFLGAGESFMGVFMMALFLVTFTRKMTR